jgi:dTDP-glucose 4,6-dehydratase
MRLLVTGGAGFIGANFVHYWLRRHPSDTICVLDGLTYAGNRASLAKAEGSRQFRFVRGDIRDSALVETLMREAAIDTIVHLAAESHVDRSILGPDAFVETNIVGTHSLLKVARKVWIEEPSEARPHRFHHVSTDEVYGALGPDDPPFSETSPYAPNSPYSASKAASDHLVRAYHRTYGLQVTTSNCSNNYGPFQFPEKLIPLMIVNLIEGKALPVYGEGRNVRDWIYVEDHYGEGRNVRDWIYVEDHCRGVELVLERGRVGETYVFGGESERVNIDTVRLLCRLVDEALAEDPALARRFPNGPAARGEPSESLIRFVKDRPAHDLRYAIDSSKSASELGYRPRETFEGGVRRTLRWYLDNERWWRAIMDGSYRDWIERQYAAR